MSNVIFTGTALLPRINETHILQRIRRGDFYFRKFLIAFFFF